MVKTDQAVGRPVSKQALYLGRATDAASRVTPDGDVEPLVTCNTGTRAGRARGWVLVSIASRIEGGVVVDPICGGFLAVSELAWFLEPDNDGASVNEALDGCAGDVALRVQVVVGTVSVRGFGASQLENILGGC